MLVLSRKRDEQIVIGDEGANATYPKVVITIVDIRGDKVRIGVEAPKEITVHRQEVYDAIKREGPRNGGPKPAA
jgi:carbon storage regulator